MNFGEDLSLQVMLANKSYQHYFFTALKEIEIYQHYQILLMISRAGGRTEQKKICEALQIEKSNMVAIITLLEKKGYAVKEVNYKDKRGKLISLTAKAKDLVDTIVDFFNALEEHLADEVTWQEMHNCLRVLNKVNQVFKTVPAKLPAKAQSLHIA